MNPEQWQHFFDRMKDAETIEGLSTEELKTELIGQAQNYDNGEVLNTLLSWFGATIES